MKTTFTHKGYGRIYCENPEDVPKVQEIIKSIDEYEWGYMPRELVAPFFEYPRVVYVHKFSDMDMSELTARCWKAGVRIWVFDAGFVEYPRDATREADTQ